MSLVLLMVRSYPFFVFKGKPGARIEKGLPTELGEGVLACCQEKGWMNEETSKKWVKKVWMLYVAGHQSSFLLLDEFKCHMTHSFISRLSGVGTDVDYNRFSVSSRR